MAVTRSTLHLAAGLRRSLAAITDARTRALTARWVDAWAVISRDLDTAAARIAAAKAAGELPAPGALRRDRRLNLALGAALDELGRLAAEAADDISTDAHVAIETAAAQQRDIIASQLPASGPVVRSPELGALQAIVERTTERVHALTRPLPQAAVDAMRASLIRAAAAGENPRATARAMMRAAGSAWNGGLTRALVISRTEVLDAARASARAAHHTNAHVLDGWVWLAALGPRCCPACWARHGTRHDLAEPGPQGHPQCRCTRMPVTRPWADLGITLREPASVVPDARAEFARLTPTQQLRVMGPARLQALRDDPGTWDRLATIKTTPGWRPAVHPTPVRDL